MNPYSPPQAPVGDVTGPAPLPVSVRVVRGLAVTGSALVALTVVPLAAVAPGSTRFLLQFLLYALCVFLFAAVNILSLTTQLAPRLLFWGALLSNIALAAFFLFYLGSARDPSLVWVYVVPAILNVVAIGTLRRARLGT